MSIFKLPPKDILLGRPAPVETEIRNLKKQIQDLARYIEMLKKKQIDEVDDALSPLGSTVQERNLWLNSMLNKTGKRQVPVSVELEVYDDHHIRLNGIYSIANGFDSDTGYPEDAVCAEVDEEPAAWDFSADSIGRYFIYADATKGDDGSYTFSYGKSIVPPFVRHGLHASYSNWYPEMGHILHHFENDDEEYGYYTTGESISSTKYKFGSKSARIDASGNVVEMPMPAFQQDAWTCECWINIDSHGTRTIFGSENSFGWILRTTASGGIQLYVSTNGSSWDAVNGATSSGYPITAASWQHICVMHYKGGTLGTTHYIKVYVDGSLKIDTSWASGNIYRLGRGAFQLGANGSTSLLTGYMDEFRFSTVLRYDVSGFTPPTSAFSPETIHRFDTDEMEMSVGVPSSLAKQARLFLGTVDVLSSGSVVCFQVPNGCVYYEQYRVIDAASYDIAFHGILERNIETSLKSRHYSYDGSRGGDYEFIYTGIRAYDGSAYGINVSDLNYELGSVILRAGTYVGTAAIQGGAFPSSDAGYAVFSLCVKRVW